MRLTVSHKIILVLIGALAVVLGGLGLVSYRREQAELYRRLDRTNEAVAERLAFVIRDPLWFFDTDTLDKLVSFEMLGDSVLSVRVLGEDQSSVIVSKVKRNEEIVDLPGGEAAGNGSTVVYDLHERTIEKDDAVIGYLVLETTDAAVVQELRATVGELVVQLLTLSVLLAAAVFFILRWTVVKQLRSTQSIVARLDQGDLTQTLQIASNDEIGDLARSLNGFVQRLKELLAGLQHISDTNTEKGADIAVNLEQVAAATEEIDVAMSQVAERSGGLDRQISVAWQASHDIGQRLDGLGEATRHQQEAVHSAVEKVRGVLASLGEISGLTDARLGTLAAMSERAASGAAEMERTRSAMGAIAKSIGDVLGVVSVIDEVASQSNLLAMNAAIEAAHAGAAGKGFAIVASEIKRLSTTTSEHARTVTDAISQLVDEIRGTDAVAAHTEEVINSVLGEIRGVSDDTARVLSSVQAVSAEGSAVDGLLAGATRLTDEVRQGSQAIGAEAAQIDEALAQVRSFSADNAASVAEVSRNIAEVSESMEVLAKLGAANSETTQTLNAQLGRFRTKAEDDSPR